MKFVKIILAGVLASGALGLSSCGCCTGEEPVPPLRPLPPVKEISVHHGK